jgi:hypothetical protein
MKKITIFVWVFTMAMLVFSTQSVADNAFKKLGAQWWEWALSFPASEYPPRDDTGQNCMIGQRGNIWFLAGTENGTATRKCSVPEGVSLFFPVINTFSVDSPGACGQPIDQPLSAVEHQNFVTGEVDKAINLVAELDGKPIKFKRSNTDIFKVAFHKDNIFAEVCANAGGLPATIYSPGAADGYWSVIKSIKDNDGDDKDPATFETDHVLHIHAERSDNPDFVLDVTYHLDVIPLRLE